MVSKTVGRDTRWLNSLVQQIEVVCQLVARPGGVVCTTDVLYPLETILTNASWLALRASVAELALRHRLALTVTPVADGILVTIGAPSPPVALSEPDRAYPTGLRRLLGWATGQARAD